VHGQFDPAGRGRFAALALELDVQAQLVGRIGVADRLDSYASDLRDQSVDQLVQAASNYTRRQPAVVFGLAALAGFFALRTIKSTPRKLAESDSSRLSQAGGFYGS
jgi:predicted RNA-binding Zn ribbon-like protein